MKKLTAAALTAAALTVFIIAGCVVAPTLSRPVNTSTWTGEAYTVTETVQARITSDVLTQDGQNVIVKPATEAVTVNIASYGGAADTGHVTVSVAQDSAEWLTVTPSATEVSVAANGTVQLTLTLEQITPEEADPEDRPARQDFTAEIAFEGSHPTLHASFTVMTQIGSYAGTITECSDYYGRNLPIVLTVNNKALIEYSGGEEAFGEFPAMTRYTADYGANDTETVLLYDGGYVMTNAAAIVTLDLSRVSLPEDIGFRASGSSYSLSYEKTPSVLAAPFILDSETKVFLDSFEMSETAPEYSVKRLTQEGNNDPVWENEEKIELKKARNGTENAILENKGAKPGTYRIFVSWEFEGVIIYERVVTFYIQHPVAE